MAYAILGHGCDMNKAGYIRCIVPENCVYVTLAKCGFVSFELQKMIYALDDSYTNIHELMKDPIKNKGEIEAYFDNKIEIIQPGEEYINSINTMLTDTPDYIHNSGLYKVGNPFFKIEIPVSILNNNNVIELIKKIYNGSLYPTVDDMLLINNKISNTKMSNTNTLELDHLNRSISQEELFEKFPGVHYNFSCRILCDPLSAHGNIAANERERYGQMTNDTRSKDKQLKDDISVMDARYKEWLKKKIKKGGQYKINKTRVKKVKKWVHKRIKKRYTRRRI